MLHLTMQTVATKKRWRTCLYAIEILSVRVSLLLAYSVSLNFFHHSLLSIETEIIEFAIYY